MSPRTRFAFGAALALAVSLTIPALVVGCHHGREAARRDP